MEASQASFRVLARQKSVLFPPCQAARGLLCDCLSELYRDLIVDRIADAE